MAWLEHPTEEKVFRNINEGLLHKKLKIVSMFNCIYIIYYEKGYYTEQSQRMSTYSSVAAAVAIKDFHSCDWDDDRR